MCNSICNEAAKRKLSIHMVEISFSQPLMRVMFNGRTILSNGDCNKGSNPFTRVILIDVGEASEKRVTELTVSGVALTSIPSYLWMMLYLLVV